MALMRAERGLTEAVTELTRAVKALHVWIAENAGAPSKQDLKEMEERLLKAFGERVDPKAVEQLDRASDKLEKAIESNQSKLSGQ